MITVIPDIHADPLRLNASLSRAKGSGLIAFLGDFIDAGADPAAPIDESAVLTQVRKLIDKKEAVGVMGNHELNAILFHNKDAAGQPLRERTSKNRAQHQSFIDAFGIGTDEALAWTDWFLEALPLWREIEGLRLVHAFWSESVIETVRRRRPDGFLRKEDLPEIAAESTAFGQAVKLLVSGPEVTLPPGAEFKDFKGHVRQEMRIAWWRRDASTWRDLAVSVPDPDLVPSAEVDTSTIKDMYAEDAPPVLVGHYKLKPPLRLDQAKAACLDYPSVPCIYCWGGEGILKPGNLVAIE